MQSAGNKVRMSKEARDEYDTLTDTSKGTIDDVIGQTFGSDSMGGSLS